MTFDAATYTPLAFNLEMSLALVVFAFRNKPENSRMAVLAADRVSEDN